MDSHFLHGKKVFCLLFMISLLAIERISGVSVKERFLFGQFYKTYIFIMSPISLLFPFNLLAHRFHLFVFLLGKMLRVYLQLNLRTKVNTLNLSFLFILDFNIRLLSSFSLYGLEPQVVISCFRTSVCVVFQMVEIFCFSSYAIFKSRSLVNVDVVSPDPSSRSRPPYNVTDIPLLWISELHSFILTLCAIDRVKYALYAQTFGDLAAV